MHRLKSAVSTAVVSALTAYAAVVFSGYGHSPPEREAVRVGGCSEESRENARACIDDRIANLSQKVDEFLDRQNKHLVRIEMCSTESAFNADRIERLSRDFGYLLVEWNKIKNPNSIK